MMWKSKPRQEKMVQKSLPNLRSSFQSHVEECWMAQSSRAGDKAKKLRDEVMWCIPGIVYNLLAWIQPLWLLEFSFLNQDRPDQVSQ